MTHPIIHNKNLGITWRAPPTQNKAADKQDGSVSVCVCVCVSIGVCVCVRPREKGKVCSVNLTATDNVTHWVMRQAEC